ncbi:DUF3592 domain-containing protein [Candidatus Uabimicrobium sp. HlEnr_7]|uniref:DUF3592 domain-containing protein n=1 Tax=Candidatus Uabimicrobium helgolandensis TaxID=3095367 RepID=UPI003556ACB3
MKGYKKIINLIGIVFFILIGLFGFVYSTYQIYMGVSSHSWPATKGLIVSSEVIKTSSKRRTSYEPEIKYTYKVHDKEYTGDIYIFGYNSARLDEAEKVVAKYPENKEVRVYYKKTQPSIAVLKTGVPKTIFALFAIMLIIISIGSYKLRKYIKGM